MFARLDKLSPNITRTNWCVFVPVLPHRVESCSPFQVLLASLLLLVSLFVEQVGSCGHSDYSRFLEMSKISECRNPISRGAMHKVLCATQRWGKPRERGQKWSPVPRSEACVNVLQRSWSSMSSYRLTLNALQTMYTPIQSNRRAGTYGAFSEPIFPSPLTYRP